MDSMDSVDSMDSMDSMDSTKRLIRINQYQNSIYRFGHQSGRGERSGGLSTANIRDFSARIFSDWSQEANINVFLQLCSRTGGDEVGVGTGLGLGWGRVGWRRVGVGVGLGTGLYNYFKAAICLILA